MNLHRLSSLRINHKNQLKLQKNYRFNVDPADQKSRVLSMAILPSLRSSRPTLSFEFFPPKNDRGSEDLLETVTELGELNPAFVSVTYGAGGTTRERTREIVQRIIQDTNVPTIPHLTCIGHTKSEMSEILSQYSADQVGTILALRGDPPRDQPDYDRGNDDFKFAADLVAFIK